MATEAHCAYCFESLAASFERRPVLKLNEVEELWARYTTGLKGNEADRNEVQEEEATNPGNNSEASTRAPAITRLLNRATASSSSSSLQSAGSAISSPAGASTPATSTTSLISSTDKYPLFVTWNTLSRSGNKSLRGCIGTFEAQELEYGLHSYALTSAFEDHRFSPIPASLLPSLSAHVTLLTNFSDPNPDPMAWTIGKHGIRISFTHGGRRYGSTYLPDVAQEQGWTKEQAIVSLMRKAGWNGSDWRKAWQQGGQLVTYEGSKADLTFAEYKAWRDWLEFAKGG